MSKLPEIMKTAQDPRHIKREKTIKKLFSFSFRPLKKKAGVLQPIMARLQKIDRLISKCAPDWPVEKLNKVDLAILRLAIFELIIDKNPKKVIIDEAIELAKKYGSENSPKFVNGVLGSVLLELKKENGA